MTIDIYDIKGDYFASVEAQADQEEIDVEGRKFINLHIPSPNDLTMPYFKEQ